MSGSSEAIEKRMLGIEHAEVGGKAGHGHGSVG
jgi:hypothetical protein